jgi:hypothetical protein
MTARAEVSLAVGRRSVALHFDLVSRLTRMRVYSCRVTMFSLQVLKGPGAEFSDFTDKYRVTQFIDFIDSRYSGSRIH